MQTFAKFGRQFGDINFAMYLCIEIKNCLTWSKCWRNCSMVCAQCVCNNKYFKNDKQMESKKGKQTKGAKTFDIFLPLVTVPPTCC